MDDLDILSRVDHTLLKATASIDEIYALCEEAIEYGTASVCVPPSYVRRIREKYQGLNICTVIGFPLGYNVTEAKICELNQANADGADEFDVVINIGDVKNHAYDKISDELVMLKKAAGNKLLKVIIETCYLDEDEKIALCQVVTRCGADYIKTSTGFGTAGAVIEDIRLFKQYVGSDVKVKAAGGIRTREDMERFILEGCDRLGTSSAIKILKNQAAGGY